MTNRALPARIAFVILLLRPAQAPVSRAFGFEPPPATERSSSAGVLLASNEFLGPALRGRDVARASADPGTIDIQEHYGIAKVIVKAPGRAGEQATVFVDGRDYVGAFDRAGTFVCSVAVPKGSEQIDVDLADGGSLQGHATGADLSRILLFVIRWRRPVDMGLNVLEPSGPQPITREHPVGKKGGFLSLDGRGCGSGWREEVFAVLGRDGAPRDQYRFRLDYRSRGDLPTSEYCGDGALAQPDVQAIQVDRGVVKDATVQPVKAKCGQPLADRFMEIQLY
jgi:hypothetical protein